MPAPIALITSAIAQSNFEIIRDNIAAFLKLELQNQYTLDNSIPNITDVFIERYNPINSETEVPCINVGIDKIEWDNETDWKTEGAVTYNIDIYTSAPTTVANGSGGEFATKQMTRLAGMIRNILAFNGYTKPGNILNAGAVISEIEMRCFYIADKRGVQDALSDVIGRMQFRVVCIENNTIISDDNIFEINNTKVLFEDKTKGFLITNFEKLIAITRDSSSVTDSFFEKIITQINLLDSDNNVVATYLLSNGDFSQAGTTITAINFTFINGTNIIAII